MYLSDCPLTSGEKFKVIGRGSGRVAGLEESERRAEALLDAVPITRVSEISRLVLSSLPVVSATTPLALDLTTHLGKGQTVAAARLSAIMEAIERVSGEAVHGPTIRATHSELAGAGHNAVNPEQFDLPPTTTYHSEGQLDWAKGWDLIGRCDVLIPTDLCVSPPRQGILDQVDTNGLAAGASFGEAIRHALLEVIERDATSQHLFFELFGADGMPGPARKRISRTSLPASCTDLVVRLEKDVSRIVLEEITTDIDVPVMACFLIEQAYPAATGPTEAIFGGWGCAPSPEHATNRAITEAHQSRIGTIQSTRDSFNVVQDSGRTFTRQMRGTLFMDAPEETLLAANDTPGNLAEEVELIIDRLRAIGINQVVAVDMSDPSLGIPVVRVRVPGLSVFMVDRRRIGWRCMRHIL